MQCKSGCESSNLVATTWMHSVNEHSFAKSRVDTYPPLIFFRLMNKQVVYDASVK